MAHGIHNVDRCTGQGEPSNVWNQRGFQPPRRQKKTGPCKQALKFGENQWVVREQANRDAPRWACLSHHRSEEHTSELQSQSNLVCRLLLEKKKKNKTSELTN